MKCQYFGDKRDLFKFDLLLDLLDAHGTGRLTLVPMLTPDDGGNEGSLKRKDRGFRRSELFDFLEQRRRLCLNGSCLPAWREFFSKQGIEYMPYRDTPPYYTYSGREDYFNQIPIEMLKDACLFIDPDIGIEHGKPSYMRRQGFGGMDKYLFLDCINKLTDRANNVVFVVYQHLQRNSKLWARDTIMRATRVSAMLRKPVAFIREADLVFLVFSDSDMAFEKVYSALKNHASIHDLLDDSVGVCNE